MITFLIVLAAIVGFLGYIWLWVLVIETLENGASLLAAIVSVALIIIAAAVIAFFIDSTNPPSNPPTHGSCKYEHWAGKSYVCDEYYPPPQRGD